MAPPAVCPSPGCRTPARCRPPPRTAPEHLNCLPPLHLRRPQLEPCGRQAGGGAGVARRAAQEGVCVPLHGGRCGLGHDCLQPRVCLGGQAVQWQAGIPCTSAVCARPARAASWAATWPVCACMPRRPAADACRAPPPRPSPACRQHRGEGVPAPAQQGGAAAGGAPAAALALQVASPSGPLRPLPERSHAPAARSAQTLSSAKKPHASARGCLIFCVCFNALAGGGQQGGVQGGAQPHVGG